MQLTVAHTCILSFVSDPGNCLWHMYLVCLFVCFKQHAKLIDFTIAFSPSLIFLFFLDPPSPSTPPSFFLPCPVPFQDTCSLTFPVPRNLPTTHTHSRTNSALSPWLLLQPGLFGDLCTCCVWPSFGGFWKFYYNLTGDIVCPF